MADQEFTACAVDGCRRDAHAKGKCRTHYQAEYRLAHKQKFAAENEARRVAYAEAHPPEERTCAKPGCGVVFKSQTNRAYHNAACAKAAKRQRDRVRMVTVRCDGCGEFYERRTKNHKRRYCSSCNEARVWEEAAPTCSHGTSVHRRCAACALRALADQHGSFGAYRKIIRLDLCSYCGARSGGIDHIQPLNTGGHDDWANLTGCCATCNSAKYTHSLLGHLLRKLNAVEIERLEEQRVLVP